METKLTLSMDATVIKKAKEFAKKNHTSLSRLIEDYFAHLTLKEKKPGNDEISPLVKSLSGVIQVQEGYDYKKDRTAYLAKKHK